MNGMSARSWERFVIDFFHHLNREEAVSERSTEDENQPPRALSVPEVADVKEVKVCTVINQKLHICIERQAVSAFPMFGPFYLNLCLLNELSVLLQ